MSICILHSCSPTVKATAQCSKVWCSSLTLTVFVTWDLRQDGCIRLMRMYPRDERDARGYICYTETAREVSSCPPAVAKRSARHGTWEEFSPASRAGARTRTEVTCARYAAPPTITPRPVCASVRARIVTPYDAEACEDALRHFGLLERHRDLPDRIRFGFPIGNMPPIFNTTIHPNYPAAREHMAFIKEYIDEQVSKGRMTEIGRAHV